MIQFHETKLSNGMTVIGEQRDNAVSSAVGFFVRTGARDEEQQVSGVSHFLEHMMFKGTAKRSALEITYEMGAMGAQSNAFTSEENTVYYMAVLPEYFENALELLSDMMRPSLDPQEFNTEKKVILEEIALYKDRPGFMLFEAVLAEYFRGHTAGNSILGSVETISALNRDQMKGYFDRRYTASNITLAVSGKFSWPRLVELAEKYCGHWPKVEASRAVRAHKPAKSARQLTKNDLHCAHLCLVAEGPSACDEERYAAEVLCCILGDSSGSRTYWELIDKGLADSASIDPDEMDGTGIVYGYVSGEPERIEQIGDILSEIMKTPRKFTEEELERAKTKLATRLVLQGESSMKRLMAIGNAWTYRKKYSALADELQRVQALTQKDIETLLEKYSFEPITRMSLVPTNGSAAQA